MLSGGDFGIVALLKKEQKMQDKLISPSDENCRTRFNCLPFTSSRKVPFEQQEFLLQWIKVCTSQSAWLQPCCSWRNRARQVRKRIQKCWTHPNLVLFFRALIPSVFSCRCLQDLEFAFKWVIKTEIKRFPGAHLVAVTLSVLPPSVFDATKCLWCPQVSLMPPSLFAATVETRWQR